MMRAEPNNTSIFIRAGKILPRPYYYNRYYYTLHSVVDCRSSSELLLYRSRSCSSRRALPHLLEKVCAPSQTLKLVIKISENLKVVNQKIQKLGAVQSSNVGCQCDSLFSLSKIRNRRISGPVLMDP